MKIYELIGERTKQAEKAIRTIKPAFVVFVGHGFPFVQTVECKTPFLTPQNASLMQSKIGFFLSCWTARALGHEVIKSGALTYYGFDEPFNYWEGPLSSSEVQSCFRPPVMAVKSLLEGKPTSQAYESAIQRWNAEINYWKRSFSPVGELILRLNWHNLKAFKMYGKPNIYLKPFAKALFIEPLKHQAVYGSYFLHQAIKEKV